MNQNRIRHLIIKEIAQIRRDKRLIRMILMTSVMQLLVFGYGVSTDINSISTAVLDEDRTAVSRALVERFISSGYFKFKHYLTHPAMIDKLLDAGQTQVVIRIPRGFTENLERGRTASLQTILDGSDSMTAGIISGYIGEVIREYSQELSNARQDKIRSISIQLPAVESRLRVLYNPDLKSVNFMVPGILGMILLIVTMMMTSLAIVKEKEIGTLEQLIVTPLTPGELMIGKTLPFLFIGLVDMVLVLIAAKLLFNVTAAGSLILLFILTIVFLPSALGLGIFISTVSKTQQEAMMTSFAFMLPSILLSGFMFPITNMPIVVQWLTYIIPMRYYLVIVRGIFLKGIGIAELWPQVVILAVFGVGTLALSAMRFTKRVS